MASVFQRASVEQVFQLSKRGTIFPLLASVESDFRSMPEVLQEYDGFLDWDQLKSDMRDTIKDEALQGVFELYFDRDAFENLDCFTGLIVMLNGLPIFAATWTSKHGSKRVRCIDLTFAARHLRRERIDAHRPWPLVPIAISTCFGVVCAAFVYDNYGCSNDC